MGTSLRGVFLMNFCAFRKVSACGKVGALAMLDFGSFGAYARVGAYGSFKKLASEVNVSYLCPLV
jgi:hypothetical protein